jgi:hypothetical protein
MAQSTRKKLVELKRGEIPRLSEEEVARKLEQLRLLFEQVTRLNGSQEIIGN